VPPPVAILPALAPLYEACGGASVMGPAISPPFPYSDATCQYFTSVIMCSPTNTPDDIFFYKLGEHYNPYYAQGGVYQIAPELQERYMSVCGSSILGDPISELIFNPSLKQWEQFFVYGALYYEENASPQNARLMKLGQLEAEHTGIGTVNITPTPPDGTTNKPIAEPFIHALMVANLSLDIGQPLTAPYITPNDQWEQIYEGAVISATLDYPNQVQLHRAALAAGMPTTPLWDLPASYDTNLSTFIIVDAVNSRGQFVPLIFHNYILSHGGYEWSGLPISSYLTLASGPGIRQCFESYCLEYHEATGQVLMAHDLGVNYNINVPYAPPPVSSVAQAGELVLLSLSETISVGQIHIQVKAINLKTALPVSGLVGEVDVSQIDGSIIRYTLPMTDSTGTALLTLAIPAGYGNGEIVNYQVCVNLPESAPLCQPDIYMVWGQ